MKTMLFWCRKGCRKPKMQGLATAEGSAVTIHTFCKSALDGRGRFWLVTAGTAFEGRRVIRADADGDVSTLPPRLRPGMRTVLADGKIRALGTDACLALAGAADSIAKWDSRIARRGRVTIDESRALRSNPFASWNLDTAFGRGLGQKG